GGTGRSVEVREGPEREDLTRSHGAEGVAGECQGTGGDCAAVVVVPGDAGRAEAGTNGSGVVAKDRQMSAGLEEVPGQHWAVEEARDGSGVAQGGGARLRCDGHRRAKQANDADDRDS